MLVALSATLSRSTFPEHGSHINLSDRNKRCVNRSVASVAKTMRFFSVRRKRMIQCSAQLASWPLEWRNTSAGEAVKAYAQGEKRANQFSIKMVTRGVACLQAFEFAGLPGGQGAVAEP